MTWHRPHAMARVIGETLLCTRQQAALLLKVHPDHVRRRYEPVACDVKTRAVLIDAQPLLDGVSFAES